MATNVKPGDVAMVKAPFVEPGRGAIVEVVRAARREERVSGVLYLSCFGQGWVVRGWVAGSGPELVIGDECLRPIRWNEGEDEVLRIAGKPCEVTA